MQSAHEKDQRSKTLLELDFVSCLAQSQKDSQQWQDDIGRLVGLAFLRTTQADTQVEEVLALTSLILRAQLAGSKEAKKRVLNLSRIKDGIPTDYSFPGDSEESIAQLKVLAKVKAPWCTQFIYLKLRQGGISKRHYDAYFEWAAKNTDSVADFFGTCVLPVFESDCDQKSKVYSLRRTTLLAEKIRLYEEKSAASSFHSFVQLTLPLFSSNNVEQKLKAGLLSELIHFLRRIVANCPGVLLSTEFLLVVKQLSDLRLGKLEKVMAGEIDHLTMVTISLLGSTMSWQDPSGDEQVKSLIPVLIASLPKFAALLKKEAERNPLFRRLTEDPILKASGDKHSAADYMAELLVRWFRYRKQGALTENELTALNQDIERLGASLRVKYIGSPGACLTFDPRAHIFASSDVQTFGAVEIKEPGVCQVREDGTERVLIQAVVAPILK